MVAVVLHVLALIPAILEAQFFADDFTNLTRYYRTVGDLSDAGLNAGKYTINFYWAAGTVLFGQANPLPFVVFNTLCVLIGAWLWVRYAVDEHRSATFRPWVIACFVATTSAWPIMLWPSNSVHAIIFPILAGIAWAKHRASKASSARELLGLGVFCGALILVAVVSNPLYLGLASLVAWNTVIFAARSRVIGCSQRVVLLTGVASVVLSVGYALVVAVPQTRSASAYSNTGLGFVRSSVRFYWDNATRSSTARYFVVATVVAAVALSAEALVRRRDGFSAACTVAAGAISWLLLLQGTQRAVHYLAVPLLLLMTAVGYGFSTAGGGSRLGAPIVGVVGLLLATIGLVTLTTGSSSLRQYFITTPYGSELAAVRTDLSRLVGPGAVLCAEVRTSSVDNASFIAGLAGPAGFQVPPVSAVSTQFVDNLTACPGGSTRVLVERSPWGTLLVQLVEPVG